MLASSKGMSPSAQLVEIAALLHSAMRAVDSHIRLEILVELAAGESDVSGMAKALSLDISHVSKNLIKFYQAGIATCRRDKKRRIYALSQAITVCRAGRQLRFRMVAGEHLDCDIGVPLDMVNELRAERGIPPCVFPGQEDTDSLDFAHTLAVRTVQAPAPLTSPHDGEVSPHGMKIRVGVNRR